MSRSAAVFVALGLIGLGLGAALFVMAFEPVEETVHIGPNGEALRNPYLAAERFLGEMGLETTGKRFLDDLPEPDGALVLWLSRERQPLTRRAERLERWMQAGGHLVVVPVGDVLFGGDSPVDDPLLDPRGVVALDAPPSVSNEWPGEGVAKAFRAHGCLWFDREPDRALDPGDGVRIASWAEGAGRLTVLTSADFATNDRLGEPGCATLLWQIAAEWQPSAEVWIVRSDRAPTLFGLLATHAWPLLVSLGVLLVVWLYGRARRFGPVLQVEPVARRSLLEHLDATARFLWRAGEQESLLVGVREDFWERCRRRRPELVDLPLDEQTVRLGAEAGLPAHDVREALFGRPAPNAEAFMRAIGNLVTLRSAL